MTSWLLGVSLGRFRLTVAGFLNSDFCGFRRLAAAVWLRLWNRERTVACRLKLNVASD